eukprot:5094344-Pleurochrysis_carterae.AAC.1
MASNVSSFYRVADVPLAARVLGEVAASWLVLAPYNTVAWMVHALTPPGNGVEHTLPVHVQTVGIGNACETLTTST